MPRVIRTLCFEELGVVHQPLLDTPIGKLSIRQMAVIILFAVLAFFVATMAGPDLLTQLIIAAPIAIIGIAVFGRKVKTIPPERLLLYLLTGGGAKAEKARPEELPAGERPTFEKPLAIPNVVNISSDLDSPVKLVGVLRDQQTGRTLPNRPYDVFIDGEKTFSGVTDENGFFTVFFTPSRYGLFNVEVKPEKSVLSHKVTIQVVPRST